jgi:Tol biopolymer transport system component
MAGLSAFVATANGVTALWVRPLEGTVARMIPGTEGAAFPFWSPDSKSIAFFSHWKLQRVDPDGGTPILVCEVTTGGYGGTWTSDGQIFYGSLSFGLRRVSASGGAPSPLTTLDGSRSEKFHLFPQILPKNRILFWVQSDKLENTGVYAAPLARPNEKVRLLTTDTTALHATGHDGKDYLIWQREGALVAQGFDTGTLQLTGDVRILADRVVTAGAGGMDAAVSSGLLLYSDATPISQFTWFDRAGRRLGVLGEPGENTYVRLSPDGRRLAIVRTRPTGRDLWLQDTDRNIASRFTSTPGLKLSPVWSPDGLTIIFSSSLPVNLFRKAVAGGGDEQRLMQSSNPQLSHDWSRDGRFVLYAEIAAGTGLDLWILPVTPDGKLAPDAKPMPYLRTQFNEWLGRFSPEPEPRWVAYVSDESGRFEIYVDAFPELRNKVPISTGGGTFPEWSPDGRELFYLTPDSKLMQVSLKRGTDSIEPSSPRELFTLPVAYDGFPPYEVAPGGQKFLVRATPVKQASRPLTLIVNWPALMKKATAAQ